MQICVDCSSMVCVRYNRHIVVIGSYPCCPTTIQPSCYAPYVGKVLYNHKPTTFVVGICSLQDYPAILLEPLYVARKPFMEGLHFKLAKNMGMVAYP